MFEKYENEKFIKEKFFKNDFQEFHPIDDREFWEGLDCEGFIKNAQQEKQRFKDFKVLTASMLMRFTRDGNRAEYEGEYFKRRNALVFYTFLECFENKGEYLDIIIDLLWMILEERTWVVPAHICLSPEADALPQHNGYSVDLFNAETGAILCFVYAVMKERFNSVSKNINPLILKEVKARVTDAYLERDDYWWMGFLPDRRVNNWNPWINANVLITVPFVCTDEEKQRIILKIMKGLDKYAVDMPHDGACDEGATYWSMAGLKLMEAVYYLHIYSDGAVDVRDDEQLKNIFRYIEMVYIANDRVANFADSGSRVSISYGIIYKIAKFIDDLEMKAFSKKIYDVFRGENSYNYENPHRIIAQLEADSELCNVTDEYKLKKSAYFESIGVMTERLDSGLYLAAKGGNNQESHNHNDIGSFMIYKNGEPFIIDVGNMVYSRDTFSKNRYKIWTNVSEYHNLPTIGTKNQHDGMEFAAADTEYKDKTFSLDIKNAYERSEEIKYFRRSFDFSGSDIRICDDFELEKAEKITFNFMSAVKPVVGNGVITFENNGHVLKMSFQSDLFETETEKIEISDRNLNRSWGECVYRIKVITKFEQKKNKFYWIFE